MSTARRCETCRYAWPWTDDPEPGEDFPSTLSYGCDHPNHSACLDPDCEEHPDPRELDPGHGIDRPCPFWRPLNDHGIAQAWKTTPCG